MHLDTLHSLSNPSDPILPNKAGFFTWNKDLVTFSLNLTTIRKPQLQVDAPLRCRCFFFNEFRRAVDLFEYAPHV